MRIDNKQLRDFVESNPNLVTRKQSIRYPDLFVLKYRNNVFYDNLWNRSDLLVLCRGLIVDSNYNVIVKPLTKLFNYGENGTSLGRDELCTAHKKINGFMGVATYAPRYSKHLIVSTTGSLDSPFSFMAEKWVKEKEPELMRSMVEGMSLVFEVCDPEDPHIISEKPGLYLLCGNYVSERNDYAKISAEHLDHIAEQTKIYRPSRMKMLFSDVLDIVKTVKHEGFMVYSEERDAALKVKSPYYLSTKFLARASEKKLTQLILDRSYEEAIKNFDEEFYPIISCIINKKEEFIGMQEQERIAFVREFFNKKE